VTSHRGAMYAGRGSPSRSRLEQPNMAIMPLCKAKNRGRSSRLASAKRLDQTRFFGKYTSEYSIVVVRLGIHSYHWTGQSASR
jgi:hypothetical protein